MLKTEDNNQVPGGSPSSFVYQFPTSGTIAAHSFHLLPAHLHLLNLGMSVKKLLQFCWVDVLSSPNNHVFAAAYDFAVAVLIQAREVPAVTLHS